MELAARLQGIPPTIFSRMSALAASTGSINLGQGFPDTDGPEEAIGAAVRALRDGANQYAPYRGIPALLEAIAAHQQRHYGLSFDPASEVVVTTGATEGIAAAILGLVEPGDEVLVLEPYYDSYAAMIQMAGAVRRTVALTYPDFRLSATALREAITPRTRMILLNTPHNPTGSVMNAEELQAVAAAAIEHDLIVVTDEVYEHLTYDTPHTPLASVPGMRQRTLTLSSIGKSYSLTGWKIGWATGPAELVEAVLAAKQWLTFTSGAPLQPAAAYALEKLDSWPGVLREELRTKRDLLVDGLNSLGLPTTRPQGTYFAVSDISSLGWDSGTEFTLALPARAGVVAIGLEGFCDSDAGRHLVRWAFCKRTSVLDAALERLARADLSAG